MARARLALGVQGGLEGFHATRPGPCQGLRWVGGDPPSVPPPPVCGRATPRPHRPRGCSPRELGSVSRPFIGLWVRGQGGGGGFVCGGQKAAQGED